MEGFLLVQLLEFGVDLGHLSLQLISPLPLVVLLLEADPELLPWKPERHEEWFWRLVWVVEVLESAKNLLLLEILLVEISAHDLNGFLHGIAQFEALNCSFGIWQDRAHVQ